MEVRTPDTGRIQEEDVHLHQSLLPDRKVNIINSILVTGGSGFVGSHVLCELLRAGHKVRTTVRNLSREAEVRDMLKIGDIEAGDRLSFFAADLENDQGWPAAVEGCDYVLHIASPFPSATPKHEDEIVVPAREGALRVLRACRNAGVKRVVLTSSFAAVGYGLAPQTEPFDETNWTNPNGKDVSPYIKSKVVAERSAWDFMAKEGGTLELSVVNPVGIFGPVLGQDLSSSIALVKRLLDGSMPACPRIYFGVVDVRDVADLHLRAMTHPAAAGKRFIAVAGKSMSLIEVAGILRKGLGSSAAKVPTRQLPDWMVRLAALRDPAARQVTPQLGKIRSSTSRKAREVLGWAPRSNEETILATGESLLRLGLVK